MTSTRSGKMLDAFRSPPHPDALRGLGIARARLGMAAEGEGDRRARAEALAKGLVDLRTAVGKDTLP